MKKPDAVGKLKFRFVLVNMALLMTVMLGIFTGIYFIMQRSAVNQSESMIDFIFEKAGLYSEQLGFNRTETPPQKPSSDDGYERGEKPFSVKPDFLGGIQRNSVLVKVGSEGNIIAITYNMLNKDDIFSSDQPIENAVQSILGRESGTIDIDGIEYRFGARERGGNSFIVFLDITPERLTTRQLLLTFAVIGIAGTLVLFGVSVLLASWAAKPMEDALEKQRRFVADASHELKTPLTVIAANADVVLSNPGDTVAEQAKWLEYIKAETARMSRLVQDLLYIAKNDSASRQLVMCEFPISETIDGVCLAFESVAFEAGKEFDYRIDPELKFTGDEERIKQLAIILIDNAISHSDENGRIAVRLSRERQSRLRFSVSNTGSPIPEAERERIFERFYRVDNSRDRKTGGFGLGLSIAKSIVELHKGSISVDSDGGITTFTVII